MIETSASLIPTLADYVRGILGNHMEIQRHAEKIRSALMIELRCNLELIDLVGEGVPDQVLLKEVLALLQLQTLQAVYGLELDGVLAIGKLDKSLRRLIESNDIEMPDRSLPSGLSGKAVSDLLDYLLRKGIEMKAVAALSDKAVIALPKSIAWRKRVSNYRQVLLFTIRNLKTIHNRKAKS